MDEKELISFLVKNAESNRGKYFPWWDGAFEDMMCKYDLFSEQEARDVTESVDKCSVESLSAPIGSYGLTAFHLLIWCGFSAAVENALKRGIHVNVPADSGNAGEEYFCSGVTPLMAACYRGNLKMVTLLLDSGADAELCDAKGRNAYHYLAGARIANLANGYRMLKGSMEQREPIARLLSGDINKKDDQGSAPLSFLLHGQNTNYSWALAGIFIEKGADTQARDEDGSSLLMTAIRNNHTTAAMKLMEDSGLVSLPDNEGCTPLHLAVKWHRLEMCMALLDKRADKNFADKEGKSPKEIVLEYNDADFKQLFTTGRIKLNTLSRITSNAFAGCSSDERDKITIALYLARKLIREVDTDDDDELNLILSILYSALVRDEECQVLDLLKEAGIDFTAPIHSGGAVQCIRDYCLGGNYGIKVIQKFMEMGLDMDTPIIKGRTPASIVASQKPRVMMNGQKDEYFEEAASFFSCESMEYVDDQGITAMHEAARNDHVNMLRVMIEKGADVNIAQDAPADAGRTPLHVACANGNVKSVKLLMESGADDTLQDINGETPAHLVMNRKKFGGDLNAEDRIEILEALQHADIQRNDGRTPLMQLMFLGINDVMDILPVLLDKGVDVNQTDNAGNSALILNAREHCYNGIVKELLRAGADVNGANKDGNTPLHFALRYGNQESACFLIKKGADYNQANNEGVTPVQIAVEKGFDTVLELMTDIKG